VATGKAEPPMTLKLLAQHLGLSQATVSLVLNQVPAAAAIPQFTQQRILEAATRLKYRPNFYAKYLSKKRTYTVGVILPEISEGYAASVLEGIQAQLVGNKYLYFVTCHQNRADLLTEYNKVLTDRAVEGLILVNTPVEQVPLVPTVSVSCHTRMKGVVNIHVDNVLGCHLALQHLVRLGHSRIAFFKGHPGSADTEPRWSAIVAACSELGIKVDPALTIQLRSRGDSPEPSTPEEGYFYARKLLDSGEVFSALFAFNDVSAIGAISALRDAGLRVPEDVSVIGFDDIMAAAYQNPRLTTVRQPLRRMGELAAEILLQRIAGDGATKRQVFVEPELIVRESTAQCR